MRFPTTGSERGQGAKTSNRRIFVIYRPISTGFDVLERSRRAPFDTAVAGGLCRPRPRVSDASDRPTASDAALRRPRPRASDGTTGFDVLKRS
jgi:hypothetical protein